MTEMQRKFEEWLSINTPCCSEYNRQQIEWLMWQAWQEAWTASRAEIVVKTSTMKDPSYEATSMVYLDSVEKALDDAGVSYE